MSRQDHHVVPRGHLGAREEQVERRACVRGLLLRAYALRERDAVTVHRDERGVQ